MKTASTRSWLILLGLTAITVALAETGAAGSAVLVPVLLAAIIKGGIVIERFMALRDAPAGWRWAALGWLFTVTGLIAFAFHQSQI